MGKLKVCKSKCNQCLFSKNKIVSNARKREILADCSGFYNRFSTNLIRIMGRLGEIEFIDHEQNMEQGS